ncbi:MAG: PLP-dependent aminotransferase family protein [Acidimicrobiia bacterium]|nr:PLP-dependent aminotransferase family protein [Acidimicrobiia bacterium]
MHITRPIDRAAPTHLSRRATAMRSSEIRDLLRLAERPEVISLAGGLPDPGGFPAAAMSAALVELLDTDPAGALQYSSTEGIEPLRVWIAARHAEQTGQPTSADHVLVTTGSQQGLDLLGRVLADPGDEVAAEHPGYLGALQAMRANGLAVTGIPVDGDGPQVDVLEARLSRGWRPRFVYTVPTFQNPTGTSLSDERRRQLAALADRYGFCVIEDSSYAALRFRGQHLPPVAAHNDRAISLGTFSKTLAPGLRLGWLIGPAEVVGAAARAKQAVDLHTASLSQHLALRLVLQPGWFDAHVATLAARYGERSGVLRTALDERIGYRFELTDPDGGMFLWASPRPGATAIDTRELLAAAVEHGTAFVPGAAFAAHSATNGDDVDDLGGCMRLSFATATPSLLVEAADRLARAIGEIEARIRSGGAASRG